MNGLYPPRASAMCSDNHSLKQEMVRTKEIRIREVRLESSIPGVHMLSQVDNFPVPMTAESKKVLNPHNTEGLLLQTSRTGGERVRKHKCFEVKANLLAKVHESKCLLFLPVC